MPIWKPARAANTVPTAAAMDSTRLVTTTASDYFCSRSGKPCWQWVNVSDAHVGYTQAFDSVSPQDSELFSLILCHTPTLRLYPFTLAEVSRRHPQEHKLDAYGSSWLVKQNHFILSNANNPPTHFSQARPKLR